MEYWKSNDYGITEKYQPKDYGMATCSLCKKKFHIRPFERNMFAWIMKHTQTPTYEKPQYICPKCKGQLNSFFTKVLMAGKDWEVM